MLTFNLKKEWFEKIKSGEKTHEYRVANDYWRNRLKYLGIDRDSEEAEEDSDGVLYDNPIVKFALGYPKADDKERTLLAKVKEMRVIDGKNTDLKHNGKVFDIEFELIKEEQNADKK